MHQQKTYHNGRSVHFNLNVKNYCAAVKAHALISGHANFIGLTPYFGHAMFFFVKQKKSLAEIEQLIAYTQTILNEERYRRLTKETKDLILLAIQQRSQAFTEQISKYEEGRGFEYKRSLNAYWNYATTINKCITDPARATFHITAYYLSPDYIHIDGKNSHTLLDDVVEDLMIAGMITIFAGFFTLAFSLLGGGIIIAVAISTLLPLLFYHVGETNGNAHAVREVEDKAFESFTQLFNFNTVYNTQNATLEEEIPVVQPLEYETEPPLTVFS